MNIYAIIILVTLLFDFTLNLIADLYNVKAMKKDLPQEFEGVYEEDDYRKSQEYTRITTRFGILTSTFNLILVLAFWFLGGFNYLDNIVRHWAFSPLVTGLVYIGILILLKSIISLPFSLYSTFVIEERFGFNKTTIGTFFMDMIKGLVLGVVIGGPLLAAILAFFQYAGALAWLYCWMGTTAFTLVIQFIAPRWIMPLFNKFTPLEDGELKQSILDYAKSVNFKVDDIFVMDGSKRSTKSNAFFTGFGKHKRIALFDTLIEKHTVEELVAVLAHEIGHYKKKHIIQSMAISILHMGVMFLLLSIFISSRGLFNAFYMDHISIYAGLIFFGMLYTPIELVLSIFMQIFSRKNEFEADRFAAETVKEPENMINALKKLSRDNLSNLTPHRFYVFLNYSHPPVLQRINAIRKVKNKAIA
ncbi:MAG TPA: M48 family metallopeptidase [Balneolales bacterium]|nr:M48 family metallopeptidase [Balneolales bacterium]